MKKLAIVLVAVFAISLTVKAQKKGKKSFEKLTPEQKTALAIKKMTLKLDLTPNQVSQIKPLLAKRAEERKIMKKKRKTLKENGKRLTKDERFELKSKKLDAMIAFKNELRQILNEKQFEKFEKITQRKIKKMKKKMHKIKRGKKRKHKNKKEL